MASFVLGGPDPRADRGTVQSAVVAWLGRLAPLVWLVILGVVVLIGAAMLLPLGSPGWLLAVLFALYLGALRIVATRA